jgi:hypothetical protein
MARTNQYPYVPTLDDYCLLNGEYARTRPGKLRKLISYGSIVGSLLAVMLLVFLIYLIWFKTHAPSSAITIGSYIMDRSILFVWGIIGFSVLMLLVRPIFFPKGVLQQIYNNNPDLQSPKIFDITETFLHMRSNYDELWFQWDAIYHAIKTDNFYILSAKDTTGIIYIPIKCLDENGKTFLDGVINKLFDISRKEKYTLKLDNEIVPEPVNQYVRLNHAFSLIDTITPSFERIWYLSDLYKLIRIGALGILICSVGFLIIPVSAVLDHGQPDFKPFSIFFLAALVLFLGSPIYHCIIILIDYMIDKDKQININYLVDESGIFLGRSSTAFNLYWSGISKIIIARGNYLFKAKYNKRVYAIPKNWLTMSERHALNEILTTVAKNNPDTILKIIK